jgi:anti-anti-sigma factor
MDNMMKLDIIPLNRTSLHDFDYENIVLRIQAGNVLDMGYFQEMWFFIQSMISCGTNKFILDMSELDFLDSSGIGIIIRIAKSVRKNNGDIVLLKVSPRIDNILGSISFYNFVKVYVKQNDAIRYLRSLYTNNVAV